MAIPLKTISIVKPKPDKADEVHLVYDEELRLDESVYRYRLFLGRNRMSIILATAVSGSPCSWNSGRIATEVFNAHIARIKGVDAPFIYVELSPDAIGGIAIKKYEFDKIMDGQKPRFFNGRVRLIEKDILETLIGTKMEMRVHGR